MEKLRINGFTLILVILGISAVYLAGNASNDPKGKIPFTDKDETHLTVSHSWSRDFDSSPTLWLREKFLTPGIKYQARANGDDSTIRDAGPFADVNDPDNPKVDFGDIPIQYVQYRLALDEPAATGDMSVRYTLH